MLNSHADWAFLTSWFFGLYAAVRIVFHRLDLFGRRSIRIIALVIVLPGLFLLYETGEHGAEMVFGYGTGTGQLQEPQNRTPVLLFYHREGIPECAGGLSYGPLSF